MSKFTAPYKSLDVSGTQVELDESSVTETDIESLNTTSEDNKRAQFVKALKPTCSRRFFNDVIEPEDKHVIQVTTKEQSNRIRLPIHAPNTA